jgi:hypothetical protein
VTAICGQPSKLVIRGPDSSLILEPGLTQTAQSPTGTHRRGFTAAHSAEVSH